MLVVRSQSNERLVLLVGWLLLLSGCNANEGPNLVPVKGRVTMEGKPLADIAVTFFPDAGPIAVGTTDESGAFLLSTNAPNDGAVVGKHAIAFGAAKEDDTEFRKKPLPARYQSPTTSTFTAEVKQEGGNEFEFDLRP